MTLNFNDGTSLTCDRIVAQAEQVFVVRSGSEYYIVNKSSVVQEGPSSPTSDCPCA